DRLSTPTAGGRRGDEILIIEAEPRRGGTPPPRPSPTTARRGGKPRTSAPTQPKRPEPASQRPLSSPITRPGAPPMRHPEGPTPLSLPHSPALSSPQSTLPVEGLTRRFQAPASLSAQDLRSLARSSTKLREGYVVAEVLFRPPMALRHGPFRRRDA